MKRKVHIVKERAKACGPHQAWQNWALMKPDSIISLDDSMNKT